MIQVFGQVVSNAELVGFFAGVLGVWLTIKENIWNFPVGLVNVTASLILFYNSRLYSDSIQQAVYVVLLSYGWYKWKSENENGNENALRVTNSSAKLLIILTVITIVASAGLGYYFSHYTNAAYSYWDSTGTTLSLIAQWMIAKKKIENWIIWIGVNVLYIGIYFVKHLNLYVILYFIFLILAVRGYFAWKKHLVRSA